MDIDLNTVVKRLTKFMHRHRSLIVSVFLLFIIDLPLSITHSVYYEYDTTNEIN